MSINPIQMMQFGTLGHQNSAKINESNSGFESVFENAWNAAVDTQQDLTEKQYLQSIGEIDDTHTLPIAESKAELSLSLLVGLRNKALDAYNELMRINV